MVVGGEYFEKNPHKVLGERFTHAPSTGKLLTDAYGNARPEIRGSWEDVVNKTRHIPKVKRYDHFIPNTGRMPVIKKPKSQEDRVKTAIQKSQSEKPTPKKREDYELKSLYQTIIEYNQNVEYKDENGNTAHYNISKDELECWVTYQVENQLFDQSTIEKNDWGQFYNENPPWEKWLSADIVAYDGDKYIPSSLYYSGNIYERIRKTKNSESSIVAKIGQAAFERQLELLEASKPKKLIISEDKTQKLFLAPWDKIWDDVEITELADGTVFSDGSKSIGTIFYDNYMRQLPAKDFQYEGKSTEPYDIYYYWIRKDRMPRQYTKQQKAAIRRNTTIIGQILFDRFLIEMLTERDKAKIAHLWNSKRNNYKPIDYHKIPVGFSISKKFKGGELKIRPAQREGVAFMNSRGTGIVAYDVGVGKTMTAILGIEDGFSKGMFKRPMIVVPQKVYKKWIGEMQGVIAEKNIYRTVNGKRKLAHKKGELLAEGILPHRAINDFYNLGSTVIPKITDENGKAVRVPEYSITIVTFEAISKIGFNQETEGPLNRRLLEALSQGESGRKKALVEQSAEKWIDHALSKTEVDIEDIGVDMILVDEAHNFRNLFMDVKGDPGEDNDTKNADRGRKHFMSGGGSKPSDRAISLFMLNAYVQDKNNRRNTFGLTATPFTNRATEVYSILSLYDYEGMKEFDTYNIAQFCTTFIDETIEDSWTAAGKFEPRPVIRGYNNLPTLQSMIFRAISYKTGEEANIQRPEKVILPLLRDENGVPLSLEYQADTKLTPTELQNKWLKEITMFASKERTKDGFFKWQLSELANYYEKDEDGEVPGRTLISLNASRAVTFSPYAINLGGTKIANPAEVSAAEFVDNSPKIKYACECIRTVKKYHDKQGEPASGQIIYSDRGKEWFDHIRKYLVDDIGYSPDEVEVFHGGVSTNKREKIKEDFLSNKVKVLIGTSTMREGVDLQKHGSTIYVCYIDWNPTDVHQLFGRIWRFGNKYSHVRIVVPLIENSSDIFTWQKLSEKMSRLNSIWTKADGTKLFEEADLNAEELKKGLINDPVALAKLEIEEQQMKIESEMKVINGQLESLRTAHYLKEQFAEYTKKIEDLADTARTNPKIPSYADDKLREKFAKLKEYDITDTRGLYRVIRTYADITSDYSSYRWNMWVDEHIKIRKKIKLIEDGILKKFDLGIYDDFQHIIDRYGENSRSLEEKHKAIVSEENLQQTTEKYVAEKEEEARQRKTLEERVAEFQRLNYLLDCNYGIHNCDIYGRVKEIKSGKSIEIVKQDKPEVKSTVFSYRWPKILKTLMPKLQQKVVRQQLRESEDPKAIVRDLLNRLEKELKAIPQDTSNIPANEKTIAARYFANTGSNWYITDYLPDRGVFFGYVVLNDDWQMSEWGYISVEEITIYQLLNWTFFGLRFFSLKSFQMI
jgi:superfamily II DNA/RNA helicase